MSTSLSPALIRVLDALRCPVCEGPLRVDASSLRCPAGHTFDIAHQGYVSLLGGRRATSGDDADMVRARERFLGTGAYDPISSAVAALVQEAYPDRGGRDDEGATSDLVLDVGCGTGRHLAAVLDAVPGAWGLGLDSSTRALRSAVRAHPHLAGATSDVFRDFPVRDHAVAALLDIFAPRNPGEFRRVLRTDGVLVVVRPTSSHLRELRAEVQGMVGVDPEKEERLGAALDPYFTELGTRRVDFTLDLPRERARDLVAMTPSARHLDASRVGDSGHLPRSVTVSVLVSSYRPA